MADTKKLGVRLALRVEGDWWVAYLALENTMDGAKRIGSILMGIIENNHERRQAFQSLMQEVMNDAIRDGFGQTPDWNAPQAAPEAERDGRA